MLSGLVALAFGIAMLPGNRRVSCVGIGQGLFTLQPWSMWSVLFGLGLLGLETLTAIGWSIWMSSLGVVILGVIKFGLISLACSYLYLPAVREVFSRAH